MAYIYIADGDSALRVRMQQYLDIHGYSTVGFDYLSDLSRALQKTLPDLLITELEFEDGDGMQFLKKAAGRYHFPIIVASKRDSESDRIMSFEFGCDDYVTKPYSMKELTLRVTAILRRKRMGSSESSYWYLHSSRLSVNWEAHLAVLSHSCSALGDFSEGGGIEIRFTASEWKIMVFLVSNAGRLVSRLQLLQTCFPESLESYDRIIDTHIKNIRAKFGPEGSDWIETVRGYGYRFKGTQMPL